MLKLRPPQQEVVDKIFAGFNEGHTRQLLYAPTGFGKTEVAMSIMKEISQGFKRTAMVLDRVVLVNQTSSRLASYGIGHGVMQADHWRFRPHERIQVVSAQTLEKRRKKLDIELLIIDECFTAGTKISTPSGAKDINKVRCGDVVYNQTGVGVVEAVSIRPATATYKLEFDDGTHFECTGNHPVFTERGWTPAQELEIGAYTFGVQGVRLLWECVSSLDSSGRPRQSDFCNAGADLEQAALLLNLLLKEAQEPDEQSSDSTESKTKTSRDSAQTYQTWRQRAVATFASAGASARSGRGLGVGISGDDENAARQRLSELLQAGHRKPISHDGHRNRRRISHDVRPESARSQKDAISCFPRLVNISTVEREGVVPVFNLQVSGHPSYFAEGKLVHNCHVQRKSTVKLIKDHPELKVIGLTATPFTKGLGDVYTHIVGAKSTGELIADGWLTPLRIFIAKEIDMSGAKKVAGEWAQDEVTARGMKITGDIVTEWIKKTNEIFGGPRKTVVFCAGVQHGKDLERQFAEHGYKFVSISYLEDDEFKRQTIEDFSKPDTQIHGLIATDILTRGFDVPDVMVGVSARPFSKSFSSHVQQMGRVMRPSPGKEYGIWLDHSGNFLRFRDDWDELYSEGVKKLKNEGEKAKKEPTEKEKKEAKCPACGALWIWSDNKCGSCGHIKPIKKVATVAGELQELEGIGNKIRTEQEEFYGQMLYYARSRGYKDGWAAHKYKERFGVFPRGLSEKLMVPTAKTVSWIRSRQIAWAKARTNA